MTPTDFAALQQGHKEIKRGAEELTRRVDDLTAEMKQNTEMTRDIRDLLAAAKLGFKVIGGVGLVVKWAGSVSIGLAAIWAFIYMVTHGGVPPK